MLRNDYNVLTSRAQRTIVTTSGDNGGDTMLYVQYMRVQKLSENTITGRIELLLRLRNAIPVETLFEATPSMLANFQNRFAHLSPNSVAIYTSHIKTFFAWALAQGHISEDPAVGLPTPRLGKGKPHPTRQEDLTTILSCARGYLRTAYVLAAFAGLRCAEICSLQGRDITREGDGLPIAIVHGKGNKERYVPILAPVMAEIGYGRGWAITNRDGAPLNAKTLSIRSSKFLHELGVPTTLHSMRHFFATNTLRITQDPLLVRDLLGHEDLTTTQIYMESNLNGVHDRMAGVADLADRFIRPTPLRSVG